jgi:hypothetical protein
MANSAMQNVSAAVNTLVHAYEEEINLYRAIRSIASRQKAILANNGSVQEFTDLLDEKDDLLKLIGQIEHSMRPLCAAVLSIQAAACPDRARLAGILDKLMLVIEEAGCVEMENVSMLDAVPV